MRRWQGHWELQTRGGCYAVRPRVSIMAPDSLRVAGRLFPMNAVRRVPVCSGYQIAGDAHQMQAYI